MTALPVLRTRSNALSIPLSSKQQHVVCEKREWFEQRAAGGRTWVDQLNDHLTDVSKLRFDQVAS